MGDSVSVGYLSPFFIGETMAVLSKKLQHALQLFKQNKFSMKEIAQKSGVSYNYLSKLHINDPSCGNVGKLFNQEMEKIDKEIETRTNRIMLKTRDIIYRKMYSWAKQLKDGLDAGSKLRHKQAVDLINALNKAYPQIKIESYTWKEGITSEEAFNEFRRLTGMANKSALRSRVSDALAGGPEQVLVSSGQADSFREDTQDSLLPAKPKAEEVPQEPSSSESDIRGEQVGEDNGGSN
jgi:hypothetical protein